MAFALKVHGINVEIEREFGKIFLSTKRNLIFHCALCEKNFSSFLKYRNHIKNQHSDHFTNDSENELITIKQKSNITSLGDADTLNFSNIYEAHSNFEPMDQQIEGNDSEKVDLEGIEQANQSNTPVAINVLQEDEIDIKTLKQPKYIKILKSTDAGKEHIPRKIKCVSEKGVSVCPVCKETLSKNTHLKTHLKRHTSEKNYKCSICPKSFFTRSELDTHIRSHTGSRPYLCTTCGEAFTTASKLNAHVNQKHIRQRDKQCSICNMSFYSSVLLKNHLIIHSDERPFACEVCDSKFKRRKGLQSHMKMHENKKEYVCDMCPARFNQKCNLNSHRKTKHAIASDNKEVVYNSEFYA